MEVGKNVARVRVSPYSKGTLFACGGKETDLAVWDAEKKAALFKAKNVSWERFFFSFCSLAVHRLIANDSGNPGSTQHAGHGGCGGDR
jgi:hypothetical protein